MGEKINAYKILVGKPEGETPLGIPKRSWEDNIKNESYRDRMECYGLVMGLRIVEGFC
jgi:hypothetical protein